MQACQLLSAALHFEDKSSGIVNANKDLSLPCRENCSSSTCKQQALASYGVNMCVQMATCPAHAQPRECHAVMRAGGHITLRLYKTIRASRLLVDQVKDKLR
jgi:hypothetical protein